MGEWIRLLAFRSELRYAWMIGLMAHHGNNQANTTLLILEEDVSIAAFQKLMAVV
jgi:hypothetical protein